MTRVFIFLIVLSTAIYAEDNIDFESQLQSADSPEKKLDIILRWSIHLQKNGDMTRAMNKMEASRVYLKDIEDIDIVINAENQYWSLYKRWTAISNSRKAEIIAERVARENKKKEEAAARLKAFEEAAPKVPSRFRSNISKYKSFVRGKRPLQRRIMNPLSMGHLNGFNTMLSIPELNSAYLLPTNSTWIADFKFDLGMYKESSSNGVQELSVDTTISRGLVELTVPYSKLFRTERTRPIDFKLGIPVVKWGTKPSFTFDKFDPNATLLSKQSTGIALGDIYLDTKITFFANFDYAIGSSFRLKLPTGSTSDLAGSGSIDYGFTLLYSGMKSKHRWNFNLGTVITGDADNFDNSNKVDLKDIIFLSMDYGFNMWRKHFIIFGFDYHQNAYEGYTSLPVLEDPPMSIGIGAAMNFKRFKYYYGLKQGLNGASADTQLLFSLRMNY